MSLAEPASVEGPEMRSERPNLRATLAPLCPNMQHRLLPLGADGSGLHYARLAPMSLAFHEHEAVQVSIPLGEPEVTVVAHSNGGRDVEQHIQRSQCYIIPSRQSHAVAFARPGETLNFFLSPAFLHRTLGDLFTEPHLLLTDLTVRLDPVLRFYAEALQVRLRRGDEYDRFQLESVMLEATEHLARRVLGGSSRLDKQLHRRLPLTVLRKVQERIEANYKNGMSMGELAAEAGLSDVHFRRLFTNTVGLSPLAYTYSVRIANAQVLLRRTDQSIMEIAGHVGFRSAAHFVAQFHRRVGVTPLRYRKEFKASLKL